MAVKSKKVKYNRHISFDDLSPSFVDEEIRLIKDNNRHIGFNNKYIHIPPQYNPLYGQTQKRPSLPGNSKSSRSPMEIHNHRNGINENFANVIASEQPLRSRSESPFSSRRNDINTPLGIADTTHGKRDVSKRLPPPPEVSILKKTERAIDQQAIIEDVDLANMDDDTEEVMVEETKDNTQLNSGSKYGYTQSLFANLNEVEDRIAKGKASLKNGVDGNNSTADGKPRRKSFANMTDEELAALENFYVSQGRSTPSDMSNYDFTQKTNTIFSHPDSYNNSTKSCPDPKLEAENKVIADTLAVTYPSRPVVIHKAIAMTVQNSKFRHFVMKFQRNVPIKDQNERRSSLRVINCYISGRRYTWSSVDWYVENLARDGDHLIILTSIPNFEAKIDNILYKEKRQKKKTETMNKMMGRDHDEQGMTQKNSIKNKDLPLSKAVRLEAIYKEARDATRSILEYYAGRLEDKIVKITVELVKSDSTKDTITRGATLYRPHAQIVSTVSTNIQIKFRNGNVKLPFFMMKYYPMPSFIVPFEFIHPNKLTAESKTIEREITTENRLEWLDETIKNTLENPFLKEPGHHDHHKQSNSVNDNDMERHVPGSDDESDDESVTSISEYFPMDPKTQKNIELFEELGYVIPKTSRDILLEENDFVFDKDGKRLTPVTSRSSRRSSRVQLGGASNSLYKVKSMIVDDVSSSHTVESEATSTSSSMIRKTKSVGTPGNRLSPSTSRPISGKRSNVPLTKAKTVDPTMSRQKSKHHYHSHHQLSPTSSGHGSKTHATGSMRATHSGNSSNSNLLSKKKTTSDKDSKKKKSGFGSMFGKFFK